MRHTWLHYFIFVHSASRIQCSVVTGMDCALSVPGVICGYSCLPVNMDTIHWGKCYTTAREPGNQHDRYTRPILKDQTLCTIGHIPHEISKECSFFILRGRVIDVEVTGPSTRLILPS